MPSIGNITGGILSSYKRSSLLAKKAFAGLAIAGTLLGGTVEKAYAYGNEIHELTGSVLGMKASKWLTKADVMRDAEKAFQYKGSDFLHYVGEKPFSTRIDAESVSRIIQGINEVPAEVALHEIADLGVIGHTSRYTPWLERQHGFMDNQLNSSKLGREKFDALRKSLEDVPAATGDFNQNLRRQVELGEMWGNRLDLRKTVPPDIIAAARLKRSVALMKQYTNLYPEKFAAIKNAPLGDMTTWDVSSKYASGGFNKIQGHQSGPANKANEFNTDSDFVSGHSYFPSVNKSLISVLLGGSLLFGGTASAQNYVPVGRAANVLAQHRQLKYLTNYVAVIYTTDIVAKDRARDILYRTAIHESQNLEHRRQVITRGGKLVEAGPAYSIFGVELETAEGMVDWAAKRPRAMKVLTKTSGLSARKLQSMNQGRLGELLMSNEKFAAGMARVKFLSVSGEIPEGLVKQAGYTAKKYFVGRPENRAALQARYKKQYIADNIRFSGDVSKAMMRQEKILSKGGNATKKAMKPVAGAFKNLMRIR